MSPICIEFLLTDIKVTKLPSTCIICASLSKTAGEVTKQCSTADIRFTLIMFYILKSYTSSPRRIKLGLLHTPQVPLDRVSQNAGVTPAVWR